MADTGQKIVGGLVGGCIVISFILLFGSLTYQRKASALPVGDGIYAEQSMAADGVTVRRVHDRGQHVVCYVASGRTTDGRGLDGRAVAISCMPE